MPDKNGNIIAGVDLDEVTFGFDEEVIVQWPHYLPDLKRIDSNELKTWNFTDNYPPEYRERITKIWREKGFFKNLKPIEGAVQAINEMLDEGIKVLFCSTPTTQEPYCMYEKLECVYKYFGERMINRVIFCKDKTTGLYADYLIDDKPEISGEAIPTWTHIHFDRGRQWGKTFNGPQLSDWSKRRDVIH